MLRLRLLENETMGHKDTNSRKVIASYKQKSFCDPFYLV